MMWGGRPGPRPTPSSASLESVYSCTRAGRVGSAQSDTSRAAIVSRITIRLDDDVIDWFRDQVEKAGGGNYQSLINDALRDHMGRSREPLETRLRRVIREEIRRAA
jgi:uncharacterized protein (DUF4415 family)